MGPTKVYRAQFEAPNTIRGKYGLSDTRNATHGSGKYLIDFCNIFKYNQSVFQILQNLREERLLYFSQNLITISGLKIKNPNSELVNLNLQGINLCIQQTQVNVITLKNVRTIFYFFFVPNHLGIIKKTIYVVLFILL